ncbi:MAG: rod shape-determining protein RodA [Candidatus Margulisiibacteriota bacterium]
MINFRLLKNSDMALWICAGLLILIGFLSIYSSTFAMLSRKAALAAGAGIDPLLFVKRHFVSFLMGAAGLCFFCYMDYNNLKKAAWPLYGLMLFLLLIVLAAGFESYGAQRWLGIGPFSFQPSEISKLILIIALAKYFEDKKGIRHITELVPAVLIMGLPFLLIFKQPDLGTALVFIAITVGMIIWVQDNPMILLLMATPIMSALLSFHLSIWAIFFIITAGLLLFGKARIQEWIAILGANVLTVLAVPFIWGMLRDYQKQRLVTFLDPSADPFGAGYHTIQSLIAIGSGGLFGRGFLMGTQTQLQFIPQQWTDFIFSVIGEEFGFVGAMVVIILFGVMIWRAMHIAMNAGDFYGSILAVGIAFMMLFHFGINIAMTLGIAPVVGIPLPFISFGGTSLIINMCAIGILQSIAMRREKLFF